MRECQRVWCSGQNSTFSWLWPTARRLEPGQLSKGYTRAACLLQTIQEGGDVFLSALSAVILNWWIPSTKEAVCLWAPASLGVAGPRVRSMGLNGSQRGTVGCGAPSLQPAEEKGDWGKAPSSIARQNSIYCSPSWPPSSFSAHIQTVQIRMKKKKSISISEWLSMPRVALTLWPCQPVW